jgi:hypothetical protein
MEDVFPVAFLPKDHALAIAIMSYNGQMNFGLLGDYDAVPDLDRIADGIEASLAELVALARRRTSGDGNAPGNNGSSSNGAPASRSRAEAEAEA